MIRVPLVRSRPALALGLAVLLVVSSAPAALARGGSDQPVRGKEFERAVEREMKAQDRQIRSAKTQGRALDGVIQRYKQRALEEDSALAHFLHGRVLAKADQLAPALKCLERARQLRPDFHQALYRIALIYLFEAKKQEQALQQAKTRAEAEKIAAEVKRLREAARPFLDGAIRIAPQDATYLITRALEMHLWAGDSKAVKADAEAVLRADPGNDAARELLARAYMAMEQYDKAQRVVASLVRKNPQAVQLRVWWVECSLRLEKWDEAIGELKQILAAVPKDPRLLQMLLQAYMGKGDLPAARQLLEQQLSREPKDWSSGAALVEVLLAMQAYDEARQRAETVLGQLPEAKTPAQKQVMVGMRAKLLSMLVFAVENIARPLARKEGDEAAQTRAKALFHEVLRRIDEVDRLVDRRLPLPLLDSAQITLAVLGRHAERIPYLERMLALLKDNAEAVEKLTQLVEDIKAGKAGSARKEHPLAPLMRRCVDEDPVVRRAALHELYELDLPWVEAVIYQRHDPRIEKDALCRLWVVKILSRFESGSADPVMVRAAARYVGYSLEDPVSMVRREAAQGLGKIGAPAGLLYMLPHLEAMPVGSPPAEESAREDLEREYNATRLALVELTGRTDYEIGASTWVTLADAAKNRSAWNTWLDSKEGVAKRLEALADLAEVTDVKPSWQLRYILADVIKPGVPAPVALRSYRILRDRFQAMSAEARTQHAWWAAYPIRPDADLTEANLPAIREAVRAWWRARGQTANK